MANSKSLILQQVETLVTPVLQAEQIELVDLEFLHEHGQWVLRFFLDKLGGITLDDCAQMSDRLGRILDAADPITQAYSLEISSPGVYRPLRRENDYRRFQGERVDVTLYAPLNGRRHFKGTLAGVDADTVVVEEAPGSQFRLPLADVAKARLDPEIRI